MALVLKMGIDGLIWEQVLGLLLTIVPLVWLTTLSVSIHPTHLKRSDLRQLWAFALLFSIGNRAFWVLSLSGRYFVELFRGSNEIVGDGKNFVVAISQHY